MYQFIGSGPGAQTEDGCSVELYRRTQYHGELDVPASYLGAGSGVLELGCGAGQGTHDLLRRGMKVTAVDNSKDMLETVPADASTVWSDIGTLDIADRFDAVILPSRLINHASAEKRHGFVGCGWRHLRQGGWFYIERHDPTWLATAAVGQTGRRDDVEMSVESVSRDRDVISMTLRYATADSTWIHSFQITSLSGDDLDALLSPFGFSRLEWLNESKTWLRAQRSPEKLF